MARDKPEREASGGAMSPEYPGGRVSSEPPPGSTPVRAPEAAAEQPTPDVAPVMTLGGLDDVPRARRFTAERLRPAVGGDLVDAAQLVATELVTNALLHGHRPVSLRVSGPSGGAVLVEVADANPMLPEQSIGGEDEMTGRGLALIDALAERWGAEEVTGGKVVWCELRE